MAVTFTQAKATLDEIADRSENNRKRLAQARALIATALSDLVTMPTAFGDFIAELDAAAATNPDNEAWQLIKAEKDLMVADFLVLRSEAQSLNAAVGN